MRVTAAFAIFEAGMPLVGLLVGSSVSSHLGGHASYLAALILIGFGLYTLLTAKQETEDARKLASARGLKLALMALTISIDGLAIGFTYGLLHISVVGATLAILIQTIIASQLGFAVGGRLPQRFRDIGERAMGVALVAIGIFIVL